MSAAATYLLVAALTVGSGGAVDDPADLPEPSTDQIERSVRTWTDDDIARSVRTWSLDDSVQPLAEEKKSGGQTTVTLLNDILFDFGKATIEKSARTAVEESVADIPKGAKVSVDGHTDSIGSSADNRKLSERRAQAVAKVVRSTRPDLRPKVTGHGEDDPVAANTRGGDDNPQGRQANRRVEITYGR